MTSSHRVRRLHRAATLLVGVQVLIWTATGFAFTWFDFAKLRGAGDREPAALLRTDEVHISVEDAVARARTDGLRAPLVGLELRTLLGRTVYAVSLQGQEPVLVDAGSGALRGAISADEAGQIARAECKGRPAVAEVTRVERDHDAVDLPVPVFRVRLADAHDTEVFVAPSTGKILAWRNRSWRAFDRLWSLHVLGYIDRDNPAHLALRILGGLALVVSVSGVALFLGTLRKKREARA